MLLGNIHSTQVKDKPLPWSLFCTDVFDEVEILVNLLGAFVLLPDFFEVHDLLVAGFWDQVNRKYIYGSLHLLSRKHYEKKQPLIEANKLISA
ncbi:MAG: hypothetical protein AVO38_09830 [delta proteobacterium ML8_D]|nr:MAG: hypothetical protein AVO38_09830 [delta proteobacterium ML8_D]